MLVYHPAFDLYHCVFRMLALLNNMKSDTVELEKLRVWDFYFLFPNEVAKHVRITSDLRKLRNVFKELENPYEEIPDVRSLFERMRPFQLTALKCLSSYEIIDASFLSSHKIVYHKDKVPAELLSKLENLSVNQENIIKLILSPFNDLPLYGENGFKERTGLLDFRYDAN